MKDIEFIKTVFTMGKGKKKQRGILVPRNLHHLLPEPGKQVKIIIKEI